MGKQGLPYTQLDLMQEIHNEEVESVEVFAQTFREGILKRYKSTCRLWNTGWVVLTYHGGNI